MSDHTWIDRDLLDEVSGAAIAAPRGRRNRNFHRDDEAACHRLLNAIEPGSYIRPHRHGDPHKDEALIVLRGRLGALFFDEIGNITDSSVLEAGGVTLGADIDCGTYHTLVALEPGTVFFEAKAGPYVPLRPDEVAPWAPAEGASEAKNYLAKLTALFD